MRTTALQDCGYRVLRSALLDEDAATRLLIGYTYGSKSVRKCLLLNPVYDT